MMLTDHKFTITPLQWIVLGSLTLLSATIAMFGPAAGAGFALLFLLGFCTRVVLRPEPPRGTREEVEFDEYAKQFDDESRLDVPGRTSDSSGVRTSLRT